MPRIILITLLLFVPLFGEDAVEDSSVTQSETSVSDTVHLSGDTATADSTTDSAITVGTASVDSVESVPAEAVPKATTVRDSIGEKRIEVTEKNKVAATSSVKKIKLRKRTFNYRQQIVLAVGMMAFIAIMMTTAQSLNPK